MELSIQIVPLHHYHLRAAFQAQNCEALVVQVLQWGTVCWDRRNATVQQDVFQGMCNSVTQLCISSSISPCLCVPANCPVLFLFNVPVDSWIFYSVFCFPPPWISVTCLILFLEQPFSFSADLALLWLFFFLGWDWTEVNLLWHSGCTGQTPHSSS